MARAGGAHVPVGAHEPLRLREARRPRLAARVRAVRHSCVVGDPVVGVAKGVAGHLQRHEGDDGDDGREKEHRDAIRPVARGAARVVAPDDEGRRLAGRTQRLQRHDERVVRDAEGDHLQHELQVVGAVERGRDGRRRDEGDDERDRGARARERGEPQHDGHAECERPDEAIVAERHAIEGVARRADEDSGSDRHDQRLGPRAVLHSEPRRGRQVPK